MTTTPKTATVLAAPILIAGALAALSGCFGGCPWTEVSEVRATPGAECLEMWLDDASSPLGGCVDPVLFVDNRCAADLVLPASHAEDGEAVTVPAGEIGLYVVALSSCDLDDDAHRFSIDAALGDEEVTISFETY